MRHVSASAPRRPSRGTLGALNNDGARSNRTLRPFPLHSPHVSESGERACGLLVSRGSAPRRQRRPPARPLQSSRKPCP